MKGLGSSANHPKGFWIWLTLAVLLLFGGIVAVILTGSLFWKIVGFLILASIISTLRGKGVFSGKKDAAL